MAVNGYLSVEFDVKSPVNKFIEDFIETMELSSDNATVESEEFEDVPFEMKRKRKTTWRMSGFRISEYYKEFKETIDEAMFQDPDLYSKLEGTMSVTHVEGNDRGRATWTVEYEKTRPDIEDPISIVDTFVGMFKLMDEDLL